MNGNVRTTTSEVRDDYYGMPVIRAPHWHWLIINYFFLAGIVGGSYCISTVVELLGGQDGVPGQHGSLMRTARYLSFAALLPCPVLLILDLGRPERFLNMLRIIKFRSAMSLGSWALTLLGIFSSGVVVLQLLSDLLGRPFLPGLRRVLAVVGLPFGIFVSGYTGVLLAATNVPLWARNYLLIGPTFVASAFSASFAAISLLLGFSHGEKEDVAQRVARAEVACMTTELVMLLAGILHLGRLGKPLTAGKWGRLFWPGTVVAGILTPLALQLSGPVRGNAGSRGRRTLTALLVLGGSFSLRALMIFAGHESAARPRDYFEYTRKHPFVSERKVEQ